MRRLRLAAALIVVLLPASARALPLVAVDPGHGGADSGAKGILPPGTQTGLPPRTDDLGRTLLYEKDVNLDVAQRLNAWLQAHGFPTVMTRTRDLAGGDVPYTTETADLKARTDLANSVGAQLFVSLHENALGRTTSGTETYRFYYSGPAARALAVAVHQEVVRRLGLPDRGIRRAGFYVLRHTNMPAVLVEGGYLTNPTEALYLAQPDARQRLAEGVGTGIVRFVQGGYVPSYAPAVPGGQPLVTRYWVSAGAFNHKRQARVRRALLRARGVDVVIRRAYSKRWRRRLYFIVTGQFVYLENAKAERDRLRSSGLRANVGPAPPTPIRHPAPA